MTKEVSMKGVEGLKEALGKCCKGPWTKRYFTRKGEYEISAPQWNALATVYGNEDEELDAIGAENARAIVLAVNLAPALIRVAEAAKRLSECPSEDDCRTDEQAEYASDECYAAWKELNSALSSLSADKGGADESKTRRGA